jgi:hypothetical protein|tara:strand:+ start:481 stop:1020 length:540 start_codon:yes stop_codon:yes gene_type:complete
MNLYKEHSNFLSKESKDFIGNVVLGDNFPFYQIPSSGSLGKQVKDGLLNHLVLPRPEDRSLTENVTSQFYMPTVKILDEFLAAVKIKPYFYLRIAYNLTYNNGFDKSGPHTDHDYDHKQVIIYLNNIEDKNSKTVLLKNNKIHKEIKPKQYKGICFGNLKHYNHNPKVGKRIVLIGTFI